MKVRKRGNGYQALIYNPEIQKTVGKTFPTKKQAEEWMLKTYAAFKEKYPNKYNKTPHTLESMGGEPITTTDGIFEKSKKITALSVVMFYLKTMNYASSTLRTKVSLFRSVLSGNPNISLYHFARSANVILMKLFVSRNENTATTNKSFLTAVKSFLNWCVENELIANYAKLPKIRNAYCEHFIPPTQEEIIKMLEVAPPHYQRVILIGSQLGVRVGKSELCKMRWSNVNWTKHSITIEAALKNRREPFRELPLSDNMYSLFKQWYELDQQQYGTDFIFHYKGNRICQINNFIWKKILVDAGITRNIRPYDLRHAFATEAIAAGADPGTVAKLMGHVNTVMVFTHYQHVLDKQKQAVMDALSILPSVKLSSQQTIRHELLQ